MKPTAPLVGNVTRTSADLIVDSPPGKTSLAWRPLHNDRADWSTTATAAIPIDPAVAQRYADEFQANPRSKATMQLDGNIDDWSYRVTCPGREEVSGQFSTPPAADSLQPFHIAFASCMKAAKKKNRVQGQWAKIQEEIKPAALVLLGDTVYADQIKGAKKYWRAMRHLSFNKAWKWTTPRRLFKQMNLQFGVSTFQSALLHSAVLTTWDDHDFGKNGKGGADSGGLKRRSTYKECHRYLWPNPIAWDAEGSIACTQEWGPVSIHLLDSRWERRGRKQVFQQQIEQLAERLALANESRPNQIHIVGSGSSLGKGDEKVAKDKRYGDLLEALSLARGRVLWVGGDVHYSTFLKAQSSGGDTRNRPAVQGRQLDFPPELLSSGIGRVETGETWGALRVTPQVNAPAKLEATFGGKHLLAVRGSAREAVSGRYMTLDLSWPRA